MRHLSLFLVFFFTVGTNSVTGQNKSKGLVSFHNDVVFVGIDNPFRVVIQQAEPVNLDQLSAVLLTYGEETEPDPIPLEISQSNYGFSLRPTESGLVEITVTLQGGAKEKYSFWAKPITAAPRIGDFGPKITKPVRANIFKLQRGVYTQVEGFDICVKCSVVSYEMIYITSDKDAEVVFNVGGDFQ